MDAQEAFELAPGQAGPPCEYLLNHKPIPLTDNSYLDNFAHLEGAPCSIQVFTTTMKDEECLEMAKIIDKSLGNKA